MRVNKKTVTITKPVTVEQADSVSIDLTIEEYTALRMILGKIAGNPENTLRGYVEAVSRKLSNEHESAYGLDESTPYNLCHRFNGSWEAHNNLFERNAGGITFARGSKSAEIFQQIVDYYKENLK